MTSSITITDDHFRPLLAEDDRDGDCGGRLRVALRSDRARLEVRRAAGDAARGDARCRCPARASRSAPRRTARGWSPRPASRSQSGVAAADPELLPVGSVIEIDSLPQKYNGIYTVMDTGPAVQGRQVDLYMWSCNEALQFGRKPIHLTVLRLGWNPRATTPSFLDRFFKRPPSRSRCPRGRCRRRQCPLR